MKVGFVYAVVMVSHLNLEKVLLPYSVGTVGDAKKILRKLGRKPADVSNLQRLRKIPWPEGSLFNELPVITYTVAFGGGGPPQYSFETKEGFLVRPWPLDRVMTETCWILCERK